MVNFRKKKYFSYLKIKISECIKKNRKYFIIKSIGNPFFLSALTENILHITNYMYIYIYIHYEIW